MFITFFSDDEPASNKIERKKSCNQVRKGTKLLHFGKYIKGLCYGIIWGWGLELCEVIAAGNTRVGYQTPFPLLCIYQ